MKILYSVLFATCVLLASADDTVTTEGLLPSVQLMASTSDASFPGHISTSIPPMDGSSAKVTEVSSTSQGPAKGPSLPDEPSTEAFTAHIFSKTTEEALTTSTTAALSTEKTDSPLPVKEVTQPFTTTPPEPTTPALLKATSTPVAVTTHITTIKTTTKQVTTPMITTTKTPMALESGASKIPGNQEEKSLATSVKTSTLLLPFLVLFIAFCTKH